MPYCANSCFRFPQVLPSTNVLTGTGVIKQHKPNPTLPSTITSFTKHSTSSSHTHVYYIHRQCYISCFDFNSQGWQSLVDLPMCTHTSPGRNMKVAICNHQVDNPFYVWSGDLHLHFLKAYTHT